MPEMKRPVIQIPNEPGSFYWIAWRGRAMRKWHCRLFYTRDNAIKFLDSFPTNFTHIRYDIPDY